MMNSNRGERESLLDWSGLDKMGDLTAGEAVQLIDSMFRMAELMHDRTRDSFLEGYMTGLDYALQVAEKIRE